MTENKNGESTEGHGNDLSKAPIAWSYHKDDPWNVVWIAISAATIFVTLWFWSATVGSQ